MKRSMTARAALAGIATCAVLVLAGCGGTEPAPTAPAPANDQGGQPAGQQQGRPAPGADPEEMQDALKCFEDNGVTLPEPGGDGAPPSALPDGAAPPQDAAPGGLSADQAPPGVDPDAWASALEACGDVLPQAPGGTAAS